MKIPIARVQMIQEYPEVELPLYFKKNSSYYKIFEYDNKPFILKLVSLKEDHKVEVTGIYSHDFSQLLDFENREISAFINKRPDSGEAISEEHFNKMLRDRVSEFKELVNFHLKPCGDDGLNKPQAKTPLPQAPRALTTDEIAA